MTEIEIVEEQLKTLIVETYDTIGCDKCELKWDTDHEKGCRSNELQHEIWDLKAK